jgi:hypothetical protein
MYAVKSFQKDAVDSNTLPLQMPAAHPRIVPNRRQIDNKFPVLGFTIDSDGLPFYEVLLTSDRSLFDPANAGRRTPATFYTSRQDGGLSRATSSPCVYLVPQAVLRSFALAQPRPTALYYALAASESADGSNPVFALPVAQLPTDAPSVGLALAFSGRTLSSVLSIPVERLTRVADIGADEAAGPSADEDAAEGEDGYSVGNRTSAAAASLSGAWQPKPLHMSPSAPLPRPAAGYSGGYHMPPSPSPQRTAGEFAYNDGYDQLSDGGWTQPADRWGYSTRPTPPASFAQDIAYDDGYGIASSPNGSAGGAATWSVAQASTYRAGDTMPNMLQDSRDLYDDDPYGEPNGHAEDMSSTYDDEAAEWSGLSMPAAYALDGSDTGEAPVVEAQPLTISAKLDILDHVAHFESSSDGYAAINADGEFLGRFGQNHPAYNRYHIGLSYGRYQFTQDSGSLGHLLNRMRNRDVDGFNRIFGSSADTLIRLTNAPGPESANTADGRSARCQPLDGADLWEEPWLARFRQAAAVDAFQAAQNETAAAEYIEPMLQFAGWLGLNTDRALAIAIDRAVQMGTGGARHWIIGAVGPIRTSAIRQQALAALGYADLRSFQQATSGLPADGQWGSMSHAALTAALRAAGARSPVQIPGRDEMLDMLVRAAQGQPWAHRVSELRSSTTFQDRVYQF